MLGDRLPDSEIKTLVARRKTVRLLLDSNTHREVQKKVGISISKVTHAANSLRKNGNGFRFIFDKLKNN